jgi:NAD(P)-dependent dehydrogenase (short-subunit alcohol dehydrogenase family)
MEPLSFSFDGKVAVITGAGGGVGRLHALELARRGASVVVNDLGSAVDGTGASPSFADAVVDEITAAGGTAVASSETVATPEGGEAIIGTALKEFGDIHIVVNNAGILRDASFAKMTIEQLDPVLDVHLRGAFNVTLPAWRHMKERGYGRIVNTASGSGLFGNFGQSNYAAAKMGLVGLTRVLAIEGERSGIRVNAIAPIARTRMTEQILDKSLSMEPEQITPIVTYLCHEMCSVSGNIYHVGGGKVARVFIGVTPGLDDPNLTPELIAESIDAINDTSEFVVR